MSIATSPRTPASLRHLADDAAVFPPGEAPLPRAVAEHDLAGHADAARFPSGLPVSVVVPSPGHLATVVTTVAATGRLVLAGLEVKLVSDRSPAGQVSEVAGAVADLDALHLLGPVTARTGVPT